MSARRLETTWEQRFFGTTMGLFAAVALFLSCVGVYGVLSYAVSRRIREIGVRMALGASRGDVTTLILGQAGRLAVAGVVAGLALAVALGRSLTAILYGVTPGDPLTLAGVAAVLLAVVFLAASLPARRAARVDPTEALRAE
jgi:putative ABC transport system permease protein